VLQFLRSRHCPWWPVGFERFIAKEGHTSFLQWAHAHGCDMDFAAICRGADAYGHEETSAWARSHLEEHEEHDWVW
jgi:hypothetical protein